MIAQELMYSLQPFEWFFKLISYFKVPQCRVDYKLTNSVETMIFVLLFADIELAAINVIQPLL